MMTEADNPGISLIERAAIDSMAVVRAAYGHELRTHFIETLPEERTWEHTAKTAAVSVTDFIDGKWSGRRGTSRLGAWLDELSDKMLGNNGLQGLKESGEIPALYADLGLARDIAVTGLRLWAGVHGKEVPSGKAGKLRTTVLLQTLTAADSPLASKPNLIRAGAAHSTALAITSGIEYGLGYRQASKADRPKEKASARNSKLREKLGPHIDKLVGKLDEELPWLKADHLTLAGNALVGVSALLLIRKPEKAALATVIATAGFILDALDGPKARLDAEKTGVATTNKGMLIDLLSDRAQEIFVFGAQSYIQRQRGNRVAADNYALAAMSAALPALYKAEAEMQGLVVREGGIGTRVDRAVLAGAGMAFNSHRDASDLISAAIADNNLVTAHARREVVSKQEEAPYFVGRNDDPEFIKAAAIKKAALQKVAVLGMAVGSVLLAENHRAFS